MWSRVIPLAAVALVAACLVAACEASLRNDGRDGGAPRDGAATTCEARYAVARQLPEVVLVLDRGCAMRSTFAGTDASGPADPEGRWGATRSALDGWLARGGASWGLVLAPDDPTSCEAPVLRTPPAPGSRDEIRDELAQDGIVDPFAVCSGGTAEVPLEGALGTLVDEDPFTRPAPLVLVIAAGAPTCGATAETIAAQVSSLTELGTDVAVIALSPDATLRAIADAAGTHGSYVEVTSAAALEDALDEVLEARASCVLDLVGPPSPDPERLRVWIDGEELAADPESGFSFDAGSDAISLNGAACDRLLAGSITQVSAAVGCGAPECVARDEACDALDDDCDGRVDEDCL